MAHIFTCYFLGFFWCVLPDELLNIHVSSSNSHQNAITLLYFDVDSFLTELIDTFRLPHECNVHLLSLGVFVYEIG